MLDPTASDHGIAPGRRQFCAAAGLLGLGSAWHAAAALGATLPAPPKAGAASNAAMPAASVDNDNAKWNEVREIVDAASRPGLEWRGPTSGPKAARGKTISLWADNLRNGGVLGTAVGVREATRRIGWPVRLFHSDGTDEGMRASLAKAAAAGSDGIIVLAGDHRAMASLLRPAASAGAKIVGWHVSAVPGPLPGSPIGLNISTDPMEVARVTALAALLPTRGDVGIVIFTDNSFELGRVKAEQMAAVIRSAGGKLLEVVNIPLSMASQQVPGATQTLLARYGAQWTHALAINDIYFDYAIGALSALKVSERNLTLLSAGDGSVSALLRIMAESFQTSTVAEPLNLQGWQLVDELNRLFSGIPPTDYVAPAHLITRANLAYDGGPQMRFDPDNGYRDNYRHIWSAA